ncbi:5-oxoprolinase subunit PxpB [Sediminibacterium soli]|uniref:5-oxoprolinase subunit PxpB n=1 Tax=Sediminibacterium soli TaxID=2698829 RepID=UPI00137A03D1|nr:5-oxoprolinase subunit PxpB [Sediminibacterium soli]NCI45090.1 5-oxoprolinase subunit PxpB [Sediminibacterium soli]
MQSSYHIYPCGDHALTIELGDRIDTAVNDRVIALFSHLRMLNKQGIMDIIPSYHTVTLVYDLAAFPEAEDATVYDQLSNWLHTVIKHTDAISINKRQISVPVCYDVSLGWDIALLAEERGLTVEEVAQIHHSVPYRVYLVGFLPGFPYMGTVDARIAAPRRSSPRTNVPMGSVGIAGTQTGIYPFDSPGGWQIIGQTPLRLFDVRRPQPCYLQPGDEVRFHPVSLTEFKQMKSHGHTHH